MSYTCICRRSLLNQIYSHHLTPTLHQNYNSFLSSGWPPAFLSASQDTKNGNNTENDRLTSIGTTRCRRKTSSSFSTSFLLSSRAPPHTVRSGRGYGYRLSSTSPSDPPQSPDDSDPPSDFQTLNLREYLTTRPKSETRRQEWLSEIGKQPFYDLLVEAQNSKFTNPCGEGVGDGMLNLLVSDVLDVATATVNSFKAKEKENSREVGWFEFVESLLFTVDSARLRAETVVRMIEWLDGASGVSSSESPSPPSDSPPMSSGTGEGGYISTLTERRFKYLVHQICLRIPLTPPRPSSPSLNRDICLLNTVYPRVLRGIQKITSSSPEREREMMDLDPRIRFNASGDGVYMAWMVLIRLLEVQVASGTNPEYSIHGGDGNLDGDPSSLAIRIFTRLFEYGWIPNECVSVSDSGKAGMMSVTAVKACMFWDYRTLAHKFLGVVVDQHRGQQPLPRSIKTLTTDTIYASLSSPRRHEFRSTVDFIQKLWGVGEDVDGSVVREVYRVGYENNFLEDVVRLFRASLSTDPSPPSPAGRAILWLLSGLKSHSHLARELVNQITSRGLYLPPSDRGSIIALAASQGFGKSARALYKRYESGREKKGVVGSGEVLVRLISLFQRLIDDVKRKEDGEKEEDYRGFMSSVVEGFIDIHGGTEAMTHEHLTSLARAYFILGENQKGIDTLKGRKEIRPDMYDLNTILGVLGEYSPRAAARMVERMDEKGLEPDSVTLGVVVKAGLVHGDLELVKEVLSRWESVRLSKKGTEMVLRAAVEVAGEEEKGRVLREVLGAAREGGGFSVSLGKFLVASALSMGDVRIGREIWKEMLEKQVDGGDGEILRIRKLLKIK
ncbi:hypothetical protein L218DRAFT_1080901 [Marasmius fiardii PR-910]|nr:hypothetical protein L218DRAFT_1080901 [Marasmius fiardii PR-910]